MNDYSAIVWNWSIVLDVAQQFQIRPLRCRLAREWKILLANSPDKNKA
jgi:hypothetical protein